MAVVSVGFHGLRERLALLLAPWLDYRALALPCPHCGSGATRDNAAAVDGAMLCDDCGCRWRP